MTSTGPTSEGAGKTATAKTGAKRHEFDATVLREYDVRGIVGDTLFRRTPMPWDAPSAPWSGDGAAGRWQWAMTGGIRRPNWRRP